VSTDVSRFNPRRPNANIELTNQVDDVLPQTLVEHLAERIRQDGRITFHDWMQTALYHPTEGYYNRRDLNRWGREGDYRTSPERSELFAATFARYFASLYEQLDRPADWTIVEMGAGDARFAAGVLTTLQDQFPLICNATNYVLDEISVDAQRRARETLERFAGRVEFCALQDIQPIKQGIVFSNELLDALPVHRVTKTSGQLQELYVTLAPNGQFVWSTGNPSTSQLVDFCRDHVPMLTEGQIIEVNLGIGEWMRGVAEKLVAGYLITVDYGAEAEDLYGLPERRQGTLRGFSRHTFVDDILERPGQYDITASIDWSYVKSEGRTFGFAVEQFMAQDKFLLGAGVLEELEHRLAKARNEADRSTLTTAAREMILPGGMAEGFQVLVQKRL
jgi:SAM-dependent MidA family methyltransferase